MYNFWVSMGVFFSTLAVLVSGAIWAAANLSPVEIVSYGVPFGGAVTIAALFIGSILWEEE